MTTRFFKRNANDKSRAIARAFFDADRGCAELALERLADIRLEFPRDAVLEYAEGCLRKDSLGQGRQALRQYHLAQDYDPKHLFSAFNAAKFARSEAEYRARSAYARALAPHDPDLAFFDGVDSDLANGATFAELLSAYVAVTQQHRKFGDCAAAAELAIGAGEWSRAEELELRRARCMALRELDRSEESARQIRREDYPPRERLALRDALDELEQVLALTPQDPKMLNFKSAWLLLMRQYDAAIAAADAALAIQPTGYLKPLTNRSWSLARLGRREEARDLAYHTIQLAGDLGADFKDDADNARGLLEFLKASQQYPSEHERLTVYARDIVQAAMLTANEARAKFESKAFDLPTGIQNRCAAFGLRWHPEYISQMADLLHDFCPERTLQALFEFSRKNQPAFEHLLHAALLIAAQAEGVMVRDACRFNVLVMLGASEPRLIRSSYREAILAPAAVDERFAPLAARMRQELERLHPELPGLVADQAPIDESDRQRALTKTLSRFKGDPSPGASLASRGNRLLALCARPFQAIGRRRR